MRYLAKITTTFALALVFSAGMAFGQDANEATINQDGNDEATVEQVTESGGEGNLVTLDQSSGGNVATIEQGINAAFTDGTNEASLEQNDGSFAEVIQSGGNASNPNVLTGFGGDKAYQEDGDLEVIQAGQDHTTRLDQVGGEADLLQFGSYSTIELEQGAGSEATILQSPADVGPTDNQRAFVEQSENDFAYIEQGATGVDDNYIELDQGSGSNSATITQTGNRTGPVESHTNVARLDQENSSTANILQDGVENRLSAIGAKFDFATQDNSTLDLDQLGNNNWAQVEQTSSTATIYQDGNSNTAIVDQQVK